MFSYNFMVTSIRAITQELDGFAARYANQIEHRYVDNSPLSDEIKETNEALAVRIAEALKREREGGPESGQSSGGRLIGWNARKSAPIPRITRSRS